MIATAERKQKTEALNTVQAQPVKWMKMQWPDELLWPKEVEMCQSVVDHWKTIVPSCHAGSKTFRAARIAIWWLSCFRPSLVISTAPTFMQVTRLLWGKIREGYRKSKYDLGGELMPAATFWKISDDHYAIGISPKHPDNMHGHHCSSRRVLVIIDEGSGVSEDIWDATDALLTDPATTRGLFLGNPMRNTGRFAKALKDPAYHKVHIDGFEAAKWSKIIPGLITKGYLDDQKARYDRGENPLYLPRCRGMVPEQDVDAILRISDWDIAISNVLDYDLYPVHVSIDWAAGGACETVLKSWQGYKELNVDAFTGKEPDDTIGRALTFTINQKAIHVFHDYCGAGRILGPLLRKGLPRDVGVTDIDSSAVGKDIQAPKNPDDPQPVAFGNQRALMWHYAQRRFRDKAVQLNPDKDGTEKTKDQLLAQTYFHDIRGRIFCLSKEELDKDFGVESMDRADATIYGIWGAQFMPLLSLKKGKRYRRHDRPGVMGGYIG